MERPALNPAFLAWRRSGELAPCRILVPGAGRSAEPLALLEAGFEVTVLDVAPSAAAIQRQRLGTRAQVVQQDLFAWDPDAPFDAVYDQTCLCALPPALLPAYEQRLARWLRPGGALFSLFMQTDRPSGPPFNCPIPEMRRLFLLMSDGFCPRRFPRWCSTRPGNEQPVLLRRR